MGNSKDTLEILQQLNQVQVNDLCKDANKLLDKPLPLPPKPTKIDLVKILKAAAKQVFKKQHGYSHEGDWSQPPAVAGDAKHNIYSAEGLCNIRDDKPDQIINYVNSTLLSSVQPDAVRDSARTDLVQEGKNLSQASNANFWLASSYRKQYDGQHTEENSFRLDAVIVYRSILLNHGHALVKCTVIYYAGVFYETLSTTKVAKNKLLNSLIENANSLLDHSIPGPSPESIQDLKTILTVYGQKVFLEQFGFSYDGDKTHPHDIAQGASLHATDALYFTQNDESDVITPFVDFNILNVMLLPYWVKDSARTSLLSQVKGLLGDRTGNTWMKAAFQMSYNHAIPSDDSCKTASLLIYTNASWTEDSVTVTMKFIYYIGVYYGTLSPFIVAGNNLLAELTIAANKLLINPIPVHSPPTFQDIEAIVATYGPSKFKQDFGFVYLGDDTLPEDIIPGVQAIGRNVVLYIKNSSPDELRKRVESDLIQSIQFPDWAQDEASTSLMSEMLSILEHNTGNAWGTQKFTASYSNKDDPRANLLKTGATLTYTNSRLSQDGFTFSVTIIGYVGVYYPIEEVIWA